MLRKVLDWVLGVITLMAMLGLVMFSIYVIVLVLAWVLVHWVEIMLFGLLCLVIVLFIAILRMIAEGLNK